LFFSLGVPVYTKDWNASPAKIKAVLIFAERRIERFLTKFS
jgi:hypothetical protein